MTPSAVEAADRIETWDECFARLWAMGYSWSDITMTYDTEKRLNQVA